MPDDPVPDDAAGLRAANAGLRAVVEAKDAENALLRAELAAGREQRRRLELRLAELERRLGMDSTDSGTPSSKERVGAKEARRARQQSERERRKDRRRGGQPGHQGKGLRRDPCCGTVTFADPPAGAYAGAVSYGPVLNAAAVLLTAYRNVPPERAARLIGMLLGPEVPAGWVDKASARLSARLGAAGFDEAMLAALAGEAVLAADETPVNVLGQTAVQAAPAGG